MYDARVESKAHHLCHVLGENRGKAMDDKERHDIFTTIRHAVNYFKVKYDEMHRKNYEGKFKEVRLFIIRNPHATAKDIQCVITYLEVNKNGVEGVRDYMKSMGFI